MDGTILRLASDNGEFEKSGQAQWVLAMDHGRILPVRDPAGLSSGTRLRFAGPGAIRSAVTAASLRKASLLGGVPGYSSLKPNRTLVIVPFQWGGSTWSADDGANAKAIVDVLVPWWSRMSAGRETLTAQILAVADGNPQFPSKKCDTGGFFTAARKHVESLGFNMNAIDNLMVTFPASAPGCGFAGLGSLGGGMTWTYTTKGYAKVWAHELGHNLGFPHANLCKSNVTLSYVQPCIDVEYGNNMDIMGSFYTDNLAYAYYSPTFLRAAQWLPDDKMLEWSGTPADYTIYLADRTDLGPTAVRIPASVSDAGDNNFWLQYNPAPRDSYSPRISAPNGGVVITMEPSKDFASKRMLNAAGSLGSAKSTSYLCDITPETDFNRQEPRLLPGSSFTDPRNRFTVTVRSVDGTKAEVRVEPAAPVTVLAPARASAEPDPDGKKEMKISIEPPSGGSNEPVSYVVDILEDPTRTCPVDVWNPSCRLTGLSRDTPYTVRVTGANGPARSAPVQAATVSIQKVPPAFEVSLSALPTSITAKVKVDDGGSPLAAPASIEIPGRAPCPLGVSSETTCTFDGLNPRSTYVLSARGTNALGARETQFTARTQVTKPLTPQLSGVFDGDDLILTATAEKEDATNVTHFGFECQTGGDELVSDLVAMDPGSRSATVNVRKARGFEIWCWVTPIASDEDAGGGVQYGPDVILQASSKGKISVLRLLLKVSLTSKRKGSVLVKWFVTGTIGRPYVYLRTSRNKACVRLSARSCVVRGLRSGSKFSVVVTAGSQGSTVSNRRTVVVK